MNKIEFIFKYINIKNPDLKPIMELFFNCGFLLCLVFYFIYKFLKRIKIVDTVSIPHSDEPINIMKFVDKYNINDKKITFLTKGAQCMDYVDKWTDRKVKGDDRKEYFNDPDFLNKFLNDTFEFDFYILYCQYGNGRWRDYLHDDLGILDIIDYGSSSIKDINGDKVKIDTLNASIEEIKEAITQFKIGTIVATQSMRTLEKLDYTKYYNIVTMFEEHGYQYKLLSPIDEAIYTAFDSIRKIKKPSGRYICIDIGGGSTQVTVLDC